MFLRHGWSSSAIATLAIAAGCGRVGFDSALVSGGDGPSQVDDSTVALDETACDDQFATRLFCDGFESVALDAWPALELVGGTVNRTTSPAYRGSGALRAHLDANGDHARAAATPLGGRTTGDVYLRAYVLVPSGPQFNTVALASIVEDPSPFDEVEVQLTGTNLPELRVSAANNVYGAGSLTIPRDRWACLELRVAIGSNGTVSLAIDGSTAIAASGVNTSAAAGYSWILVGFVASDPGQPAGDVYVDEVVADTAPIGCD